MANPPSVRADAARGKWVWIEMPGEERARCKLGPCNANGRIVEVTVTKHPTCGNFKREWPRDHEFELAP